MLEKLIALFVARGVPPFVPQLAGNGRTQQHAIFAAAGSDGNTPWGEELMCGLMAASAAAREANGEQAVSEAYFLGSVLGKLQRLAPAGDAGAFAALAAGFGLAVPELRQTRRTTSFFDVRAAPPSPPASPLPKRPRLPVALGSPSRAPMGAMSENSARSRAECKLEAEVRAGCSCLGASTSESIEEMVSRLGPQQLEAVLAGLGRNPSLGSGSTMEALVASAKACRAIR